MQKNDYLCTKCGRTYVLFSPFSGAMTKEVSENCPHCGSLEVMKVNLSDLFRLSSGGGGG